MASGNAVSGQSNAQTSNSVHSERPKTTLCRENPAHRHNLTTDDVELRSALSRYGVRQVRTLSTIFLKLT